ncbi:unnamed protein product [Thelazia callipaeda]|uniref:CUE domain-containing protein n=1 Tax=Thelazia callipaeda TaxID=103827 RepID=A0A0N5DBQ4_THECL|nr:unnamed protein product [Thelazia callipaeda]
MSMQQYRKEKKLVEEAVAKVREVVHTASKNDIILALHNFDFDIGRTIQAFCDDGAQSALVSWERSGGNDKKKNQKKKKAKNQRPNSPTAEISSSSTAPSSTLPVSNEMISSDVAGMPDSIITRSDKLSLSRSEVQQKVTNSAAKVSSTSSVSFKATPPSDVHSVDDNSVNEVVSDVVDTKDHNRQIENIETIFENEISVAEENVRNSFKCIRQILVERESHLLAELRRAHDEGVRYFNERRVKSGELHDRAKRMSAMSDREQAELKDEMARFSAEKESEEKIARTTRFQSDNAQLIKLVKNFGEVVGVSNMARIMKNSVARQAVSTAPNGNINHSTSHSSIVSSLGEDSGLGQISPTGNESKNVAEIANGGIMMKSDALTAEQLADLNTKLQESLKAQGIDMSVLSGIGNRMPTRRRPPGSGRSGVSSNMRGRRSGPQRGGGLGNKTSIIRVPDISILES